MRPFIVGVDPDSLWLTLPADCSDLLNPAWSLDHIPTDPAKKTLHDVKRLSLLKGLPSFDRLPSIDEVSNEDHYADDEASDEEESIVAEGRSKAEKGMSLAHYGNRRDARAAADMDVPFGVGPSSIAMGMPYSHAPSNSNSVGDQNGLAMMPPLGGQNYQPPPAPIPSSTFTPTSRPQQPYRPPPSSGVPPNGIPTQTAPKVPSSPAIEQLSRDVRSTSLPPPSLPRPVRRRTQESADIPTIAAFYPTLFPRSPQGDGMTTLAPAPPRDDDDAKDCGTSLGKGSCTKRPSLPAARSSYAPLPTPTSESSTLSPYPTPDAPFSATFANDLLNPNPATDYPLSEAEMKDVWERLKRDFAGVDPTYLKGPFRQLALESTRESVINGLAKKGGIVNGKGIGPATPGLVPVVPPAATTVASRTSPIVAGARTTVSPKEAFVDYEDVSHRLSDPRSRGSPRPGSGVGLFGGIGMERNPSSPLFGGSSTVGRGVGGVVAPQMDRRTSMPEVWGTNGRPPTPGGAGLEKRSSPLGPGHGLPPHQLPKNAMRISDPHHLQQLHPPVVLRSTNEDAGEDSPSSEDDVSPGLAGPSEVPPAQGRLFAPLLPNGAAPELEGIGEIDGDSYFPRQPTYAATEEEMVGGRKGGKTVAKAPMGRSRSHPPEARVARKGAGKRRARSSSVEEDEVGVQDPGTVPSMHSDWSGAEAQTGPSIHAPKGEEAAAMEEDEFEEDELEEDDDQEDADYEDDTTYRPGRSAATIAHHPTAASRGRGRGGSARGGGARKRKPTAQHDDSASDFEPPTRILKRQRVASSTTVTTTDDAVTPAGPSAHPPTGTTWQQDAARRAHGRAGTGTIRCDWVDAGTGEKCDVVFRRPYDLARHKETIHEAKGKKKQQWVCDECRGTFSRKDALMRHCRIRNHRSGL